MIQPEGNIRVMISGGGTGGHVYPALAIADAFLYAHPQAQIRFIGAKGRMEMEKVPQYGYPIDGLWISGIQRNQLWKNVNLPFKIVTSLQKVSRIIKDFKPHIAVGVGGYASGPLLHVAASKGIPTLIQEQNSYPGITNKILAPKAKKICVAYPGMDKFFPQEKIILTGNPVRQFQPATAEMMENGKDYFGFDKSKPVVLVIGGSLGARTLNNCLLAKIDELNNTPVQWLWQTGKYYFDTVKAQAAHAGENIKILPFIDRMDLAYAAADIVISRAGAISISELAQVHKPAILVPSPNVAEDHQTRNAQVLSDAEAAILVKDAEAPAKLIEEALKLAHDTQKQQLLANRIGGFALPGAANAIVEEMMKLINKQNN